MGFQLNQQQRGSFQAACLENKPSLQHFSLTGPIPSPAKVAELLDKLSNLPKLSHLSLRGTRYAAPTAAAYSALTASCVPQSLQLSYTKLPGAAYGAIFPANKQFPQLKVFKVFDFIVRQKRQGPGLLHSDAERIVRCCPNLQLLGHVQAAAEGCKKAELVTMLCAHAPAVVVEFTRMYV